MLPSSGDIMKLNSVHSIFLIFAMLNTIYVCHNACRRHDGQGKITKDGHDQHFYFTGNKIYES